MQRIFLDVRDYEEFVEGHVPSAINITPEDLVSNQKNFENLPKDSEIIVYCRSGQRSKTAINILKSKGYIHLENGINMQHVIQTYPKGSN